MDHPKNAKVVFPESGSRIDAAARWFRDRTGTGHGNVSAFTAQAEGVVAAIDAAEAPIAEKLAAALRHLVDVIDGPPFTDASEIEADIVMDEARAALAEFEKLRASAPVENPE